MINPYDRRAVGRVWERVAPGKDVFARPMANGGKPPSQTATQEGISESDLRDSLLALAAGYDTLARRMPMLRQLAAQCRRSAQSLQKKPNSASAGATEASIPAQRERELALRKSLEGFRDNTLAHRIARESEHRSRMLDRLR